LKIPTGKPLSVAAAVLAAASLASALGVAVSGDLRLPAAESTREGSGASPDRAGASSEVALARNADASGDVASALAHYRAAAIRDPRIVDPRSPDFLGPAFEARLKGWIAGLKRGELRGGGKALSDAAFLFRRMYGGCG